MHNAWKQPLHLCFLHVVGALHAWSFSKTVVGVADGAQRAGLDSGKGLSFFAFFGLFVAFGGCLLSSWLLPGPSGIVVSTRSH